MRVDPAHLTYCTNVHPGETWAEIAAQIVRHVPAVKARVAPHQRFGIGLRMSETAVADLRPHGAALAEFKAWLREAGLYVFTINGFPQGAFHGQRVKDAVYRPDWRDPRRLVYTNALARLLADLLEDEPATLEGSISTVPGGYKAHLAGNAGAAGIIAETLLNHAATLVGLARETGRTITLALEPEPGCLLETISEAVAFFEGHLFSTPAVSRFAERMGLNRAAAEEALRRHLGLCLDACHLAVAYDDPGKALDRLAGAGIRIAKAQLSAGLHVPCADAAARAALKPYAEGIYLHQVSARRANNSLARFADLPDALADADQGAEWRIHVHVPIWAERCGFFHSTRDVLAALLKRQRERPFTNHLEVETYTWDVLPAEARGDSLTDSLARELTWALQHLR
ncbi:MAG: metabolite traffic protein EboE [Rhodospirillales bacterium]|nr:metabolite traffic protein EboE [Rhodospirillales bacterium]